MANHGFDNRVRRWFKSYTNRFQCVKIGDKKSGVEHVAYGAAQGTVLGPTIFILYFDAISKEISRCKISMFADDCIIYQTGYTWESIRVKLQMELDDIVQWTAGKSLTLNGNKTQAMIFGLRGKLSRFNKISSIKVS